MFNFTCKSILWQEKINNFLFQHVSEAKALFFVVLFGLIYIYPLVAIDVYYSDDFMRSVTGVFWLKGIGRPFSEYVLNIFSLNNDINLDVSPLTQIISIAVLALSVVICVKILGQKPRRSDYLFFSFLMFNPFYIQNFAYKYDSITMSMGMLSSCLALMFTQKKSLFNILVAIFFLVASLSFYQPCISVFMILVVISVIKRIIDRIINIYADVVYPMFVFLAGNFVYYFFVLKVYASSTKRADLIPFDYSFIERIYNNLKSLWSICKKFTPILSGDMLVYSFFVVLVAMVVLVFKKRINMRCFFVFLLSLPVVFVFVGFPIIVLKESVFYLRSLVGFGLFMTFCLLVISFIGKTSNFIASILAVFFIFNSFVTITVFSNSYDAQNKYDNFVMQSVARDIIGNKVLFDSITYVVGKSQISKSVLPSLKVFPIIEDVLNPSSDWINSYILTQNGVKMGFSFDRVEQNKLVEVLCNDNAMPVIDTGLYSIFYLDKKSLVYVKGSEAMCHNSQ